MEWVEWWLDACWDSSKLVSGLLSRSSSWVTLVGGGGWWDDSLPFGAGGNGMG